jgi:hypothetical protein
MNNAQAIPPTLINTIATIEAGTATVIRASRSERWRGGGRRAAA